MLRQRHPRIRRHLQRTELDQTETAGRAIGRIKFVDADFGTVGIAGDIDQNVPEQAIHQPQRRLDPGWRHVGKRDLQLIEAVMPRFVDARRLAGRTDEHAGEQIRQRRMPLPIQHKAFQKIGAAQER